MSLLHQIVVAVLAVICFMGMAVQAPCNDGGNNLKQTGGLLGGANVLAAQG